MLVVFDLDGTLIDSRRDLADAANALIVEHGGQPLPVERISRMVGEGAALLVRRALAAAGLVEDTPGALPQFLDLYSERLLVHTRLYDGVEEVIAVLRPSARLAILTNKPLKPTRAILDGLGIARAFDWILGGDGPHPRKPDPAGLQWIAERAGVPVASAVLVGDSAIDLATARNAGSTICLARYGFGYHDLDGRLAGDELVADAPGDIPRLIASRS